MKDILKITASLYLLGNCRFRQDSYTQKQLQRLSLVGSSGMGSLCYKPEASKEHVAAITDNDFDELQRLNINT